MKKTFELEDLDCPNRASKKAEEIRKIEGVTFADVNFLTQKITVEADDSEFDNIMKKAVKVCRRVEPDCRIILK